MIEDVCNHIRTCSRCTRFKQTPESEKLKLIHCTYPLELIHIDFLTIGNEGTKKATNIMTILPDTPKCTSLQSKQLQWLEGCCGINFWYIMVAQLKF